MFQTARSNTQEFRSLQGRSQINTQQNYNVPDGRTSHSEKDLRIVDRKGDHSKTTTNHLTEKEVSRLLSNAISNITHSEKRKVT